MVTRALWLRGLVGCALAWAQPTHADDFDALVAAERAFAADAAARNTRDAFLAALADDGVVFASGPVHGKRDWEARTANKAHLAWAPEIAEVSSGGDFGYTSGPWQFTPEGDEKPVAFGHYLTVWKKLADGQWKVLIDHGISHGEAALPEHTIRRGGISAVKVPTQPVDLASLRSADVMIPGVLDRDLVTVDFLRLRDGQFPDGVVVSETLPMGTGMRLDTGVVVASAGDLAVTWGGGSGCATWFRIWRRNTDQEDQKVPWHLAVDMSQAAPKASE